VRKQKQEEQEKEGTKSRKEAEERSLAQHLQILVQTLCKLSGFYGYNRSNLMVKSVDLLGDWVIRL
jgi:hypothetical protein